MVSRDVTFQEVFGSSAAENGTKVDLPEVEGTEHELDTILENLDPIGAEPQSSPPAIETASSKENGEDVVDEAQQNSDKNLDIEKIPYDSNLRRSNRTRNAPDRFEPTFVTSLIMQNHLEKSWS